MTSATGPGTALALGVAGGAEGSGAAPVLIGADVLDEAVPGSRREARPARIVPRGSRTGRTSSEVSGGGTMAKGSALNAEHALATTMAASARSAMPPGRDDACDSTCGTVAPRHHEVGEG
jgi:hypothetical protein